MKIFNYILEFLLVDSLINLDSYEIIDFNVEDKNYCVAEDGVLEYERHVDITVIPKKVIEHVEITITLNNEL